MNTDTAYFQQLITERIEQLVEGLQPLELYQPVDYCLSNGGKRIRPLMTLLGCKLFGGDPALAVSPALGLELFHNFTLMHDDIMDNAPIRRGRPSVHVKWNANTAILSGDVLFALAYKHMLDVPDYCLRKTMELFNQTVIEVCEGQQYDMNFESVKEVSEPSYLNMIRLKTAVLPAACLKTGAFIAGADSDSAKALYDFGENIGLAFQLRDDWLDAFGDESVFGKKKGGDILANKKTWLYIKAMEIAGPSDKQALKTAFEINDPREKIFKVLALYQELDIARLAEKKMQSYYHLAFDQLNDIKEADRTTLDELTSLAEGLLKRDK